jgi:nitrogen regulatory protein PII
MRPIKKIEIVIDALHRHEVLSLLERGGVTGYTVVHQVTGRGERGERAGDDLTDVFTNCMILAAASPETIAAVVEELRDLLKRCGGVCLVSDASWLTH